MLQTCESRLLWRRRKRRHSFEDIRCTKIFYTIALIGCCFLLPHGLTQHNDDVYVVKPTPALRFDKEELTTVLLVNNENHGRYINVRPEIGLLTSTARTFIQEGVTTEYATQVVGTTLDNGRVYAQYLKKSSRVLYDSGSSAPSVVTSWVGESLHSDTVFLPQSHNDLFNADQPDWQAIDDRLLNDHQRKDNFIGNTDYIGLRQNTALPFISKGDEEVKTSLGNSFNPGYIANSKPAYNFVAELGILEENARKVAANKVLPIGDLPTYTVKQNYEPSAQSQSSGEDYDSSDAFERNPKFIYKKIMQSSLRNESENNFSFSSRPIVSASRQFATVTYYGFADFTTVVGDSIIVFSPSTSTNNLNYAHITSIKGEATLGADLPQGSNILELPTATAQEIIEPTIMANPTIESLLETEVKEHEIVDGNKITETAKQFSPTLETSEVVMRTLQSAKSNTQSQTLSPSVMLSRPSDEEILRIFNALANADGTKIKMQATSTADINTTASSEAGFTATAVHPDTSNVQIIGGATTIFFEDDPFANFVEPSKTTLKFDSSTAVLNVKSSFLHDDSIRINSTSVPNEIESFASTTATNTTKRVEFTTEQGEIIETTTDQPLTTSDTDTNSTSEAASKQSSLDDSKLPDILPNIMIREFNPDNDDTVPNDCISTSQVFLTQLPKTLTFFETVVKTDTYPLTTELKTEVRQEIHPTFEIKEATKYYCIQASTIQQKAMESKAVKSTIENGVSATTTESLNETDKIENISSATNEENSVEVKTGPDDNNEKKEYMTTENSGNNTSTSDDAAEDNKREEYEDEEASGQPEEDFEDDEEIELIYKTLYTTYTYLTTFFHDDSTSISSHTEVVTNVMTSTLGINATTASVPTNYNANLGDNEINPTGILDTMQLKSTQRFVVPSEVESFIRTDEELLHESVDDSSIFSSSSSETLATFYTTYTYYTTIFADTETEIMSHTEVITNIKKSSASATSELEKILPTASFQSMSSYSDNTINNSSSNNNGSVTKLLPNEISNLPSIPDLGDLSAITLVTDVRSSISTGNKQIINNFDAKIVHDKGPQQQQSIFEDQISLESNTDTDEIMPSATLLLQTSFTTFTYYTTMYSGEKTNIISRLETMTNTVTETLQVSKTIDLSAASVPITYFTTFTYWTKLAREGQITTLSREETISNVIIPTMVQQTQIENLQSEMEIITEKPATTESPLTDETTVDLSSKNEPELLTATNESFINTTKNNNHTTNILEPTTYYTTYTYYTTSYETDKTITDSRFETITNIITPTVTLQPDINDSSENLDPLKKSLIISSFVTSVQTQSSILHQSSSDLILYDFRKIIDADGISTIFFTTEIKPTLNSDGLPTQVVSSSSSLLINEEKRNIQATGTTEISTSTLGMDGQIQKQYKTGLVRLIEGTRIANRTTTLYQSKVIGTVIDQRYAQIIESTSSFIFEKTKAAVLDGINPTRLVSPTSVLDIDNIKATQQVKISGNTLEQAESSVTDSSSEEDLEATTNSVIDVDEENVSKSDEKPRSPFQTKKPPFISPLKPFSNRNRPQFAPKKNSSATIITRSDFTPTITATPALKTINRFSSARKGNGNGGISSSNSALFATSSRRFGRPSSKFVSGSGSPASLSLGTSGISRNRFASSSNTRNSYASSSRRLGGPTATIRSSFSRPSLFSSGFPGNSRLRVRPTSTADYGEALSTNYISTSVPTTNSQEEEVSHAQDESEDEEENTTETSRRQNNPLLRLRRPLNRPQGFTPARPNSNSSNNAVSVRRNPLAARSRNGNSGTSTTTTSKPKPRTFQPPLISQNRIRPTNSLFPPRNIFGVQKPAVTTEENKDLSEEDTNENTDDSEYEDDDEEESDGDDEEEINRRRRSNSNISKPIVEHKTRNKREAESSQQNRSNFRNRFKRPKLSSSVQAETKSNEDDGAETKEALTTAVALTTSMPRKRSRFAARKAANTAATPPANTSHHKPIRPTRPSNNSGARAQFTLREKDSSAVSTTQKSFTSVKRPTFRRPQPGGSITSRRLPSSTAPSSPSTSGKRRLKSFTNNDSTTTSRNSVTGRSHPSSNISGRSRTSGTARDSNIGGRARGRNNHSYNNNNNEVLTLDNSGTITVTHNIPAEVTIPVVNGKVTEYKQVVTAKTSTEILGPQQYTTAIAANGLPQLALTKEDSSVNYNGATEVTKYFLHETPTTTITFTPTTIRGRKTSFSHVLPSTVYSVEQVVSTLQPQISANAPLANILLSQLLLGNVGLPAANPLLGALGGALTQPSAVGPAQPATPVTEYKTHASTYVTTVFEGQSTVLPVTFQGKKILTTVFDTTAQTITATEFITDTIVTTPTLMAQQQPAVNSLLLQQLLFQQHLQQQQQLQQTNSDSNQPLSGILNSVQPQFLLNADNNLQELEASNNIRGSGHNDLLNDDDFTVGSSVDLDDIALQAQAQTHKNSRKKSRKNGKNHKRKNINNAEQHHTVESSVITLYVSGRRPGEFSTVLSTVQIRPDSTHYKRHAHTIDSLTDYLHDGSDVVNEYLALSPEIILLDGKDKQENEVTYGNAVAEIANSATQSLESIVGDVSLWYATQTIAAKINTNNLSGSTTKINNENSKYDIAEDIPFSYVQQSQANSTNQHFFA